MCWMDTVEAILQILRGRWIDETESPYLNLRLSWLMAESRQTSSIELSELRQFSFRFKRSHNQKVGFPSLEN